MKNNEATQYRSKGLWGSDLFDYSSLPSTNDYCMSRITTLRHGTVVSAQHQTAGRGRFSRNWLSCENTSLSFSVVIDNKKMPYSGITGMAAAVAVHRLLLRESIDALLKWPNDVIVNNRKISGILLEGASDRLVLGIGLNVNMESADFQSCGLWPAATSMKLETGISYELSDVLYNLLDELEQSLCSLAEDGSSLILDYWRSYDLLKGRHITVNHTNNSPSGLCTGIGASGELSLMDKNGATHFFLSGDVTLA